MPSSRPVALVLLALVSTGATLAAGATAAGTPDTWLLPARATLPAGVDATLDLTSGTAFPATESTIAAAQVRLARLRTAAGTVALPAPAAAAHALRFRVPLRRAGVATVWVSLAPRALTRDSAEVMRYLAAIDAPDSVRAAYLRQLPVDGVRRWRERSARHASTHLLASSPLRPRPTADPSWGEPTGMPLELVPLRDPTTLRAGDTLDVRLLQRGRPLGWTAVELVGPDGRARPARRTDADGRAALALPRAGRWLLRAAQLRHATAAPLDWESDFATLTVAVR